MTEIKIQLQSGKEVVLSTNEARELLDLLSGLLLESNRQIHFFPTYPPPTTLIPVPKFPQYPQIWCRSI